MNTNKPSGELRFVTELYEKIMEAGFSYCPHDFYEIIDRLDDGSMSSLDSSNNLRMFYLMYCGLAKAGIQIPKDEFDMTGKYISTETLDQFENDIHGPYKVIEGEFDHHINLRKLKLHKCVDYLSDGPEGSVEDALSHLKKKIFQRPGSVWHAQWLYKHQECIPKSWFEVWKSGGTIVFPGTQLIGDRSDRVMYAMLRLHWSTKVLDLSFECEYNLHKDKTNYFIVTVGPNAKKTFIRQGEFIETRRYRDR